MSALPETKDHARDNAKAWAESIAGMVRSDARTAGNGRILEQTIKAARTYKKKGRDYRIVVSLRFDDQCNNGHETFAMTADIRENGLEYMGGCCHDEIAQHFPEFAPFIKWHLVSTDGPMHYVANTVYLAGNRDHNGLLKGETRQIRNGKTGVPCWILEPVGDKPERYIDSETQPAAVAYHYVPWNRTGEGKERQLDSARSVAVWPDVTDAELMQEPEALRAALEARLPALLAEFKSAMLALGFEWPVAR